MDDFAVFAARYRRFLRALEIADRLIPRFARHFVAGRWGRLASPYRMHAARILSAMQAGLGLSSASALLAWRRWLESHGQFCLSVFSYPRWTRAMLVQGVRSDDLALVRRAASTGGLLLTYHSHHHNSLFCLFGFAGAKISVLATSEEDAPLFPAIGRYIRRVNHDSSLHFGGGGYLFTDNLRSLTREAKAVFDEGGIVASLCDFNGGKIDYDFLGRRLAPPTGAIALALKRDVPIYTAILYGGYGAKPVLRMRELDRAGGESGVVRQYLDFLADTVKDAPGAWQGWEWFGDLPEIKQNVEMSHDN